MLNIKIKSHDGKEFGAYLARANKPKAGTIVVIQEIFGVNAGLRQMADEWAARGFNAIVPDLFWRMKPGVDISDKTEAEWKEAFGYYQQFDRALGLKDLISALDYARKMEGASGKAGSTGYCLGGFMAFQMAAHSDADCNVSYYGGGVDGEMDKVGQVKKPLLIHLAGDDEYINAAAQQKILSAVKSNPQIEAHVYPGAQHAFARVNGVHFKADAAEAANKRTLDFFSKHLG
jgi:carboxymethylenebutenolidase